MNFMQTETKKLNVLLASSPVEEKEVHALCWWLENLGSWFKARAQRGSYIWKSRDLMIEMVVLNLLLDGLEKIEQLSVLMKYLRCHLLQTSHSCPLQNVTIKFPCIYYAFSFTHHFAFIMLTDTFIPVWLMNNFWIKRYRKGEKNPLSFYIFSLWFV